MAKCEVSSSFTPPHIRSYSQDDPIQDIKPKNRKSGEFAKSTQNSKHTFHYRISRIDFSERFTKTSHFGESIFIL